MRREARRHADLEAAIDGVVASYDEGRAIDNLKSAALPSRRVVIEAYHHLEHALYLGFFSARRLSRDNLRHHLAVHLYPAYELFVRQIERALGYEHWTGRAACEAHPPCGEDVVVRLFEQLPALRARLELDVGFAFEGDPAARSVEEVVFGYPSITAVTAYRVAHLLAQAGVPMIPRIVSEHAHARTGIDIHPGARIGERFFIDHGTGVVIGETAVIGDNVKLYQGVTLGALSIPGRGDTRKRHPTLENDVTVYAGATILGGDTVVGEGSVVGANVWLVKSVPPGSRVFGPERPGAQVPSGDAGT